MNVTTMRTSAPTSRGATRAERRRANRRSSGVTALEVIALVAIVILLIAGLFLSSGATTQRSGATSQVFVEHGETLWAIAASHPVDGQTTEQTAELIADLNGVKGGHVSAQTTLVVPSQFSDRVLTASR